MTLPGVTVAAGLDPGSGAGRSRPRARAAALAAAGAGALAVAPHVARAGVIPPCPVKALTGLDCPGCGSGRMVLALARGDVAAAVDHNLVAFAVLVAGVVWVLASLAGRARLGMRLPAFVDGRWAAVTVAAVSFGWAVARNLAGPTSFLGAA